MHISSQLQTLLLTDIEHPRLTNWPKTKRRWAKSLGSVPKSSDIALAYQELLAQGRLTSDESIIHSLRVKRQRTLSGVVPFAVMMKAHPCPGRCTFCVQEPGLPKSYMSDEPAAQRAVLNNFDAGAQVRMRLTQLETLGHEPQKLHIIVIGGTFSSYPDDYKRSFIKSIFDACNGCDSPTLAKAQALNEEAQYRVIGLSIETRPDWVTLDEIALLRECGVTKVQLGVQSLDDSVNEKTQRGHTVADVERATALLRDAGFKINHHLMPNLPGATPESDLDSVHQLFANPQLRPDTLKLYPCIVIPKTALYQQWLKGEYHSYSDVILTELLCQSKALVPAYCRIDRLARDITRKWTAAGTLSTNLRELVQKRMAEKNLQCHCIRCREIKDSYRSTSEIRLNCFEYEANNGREYFLSFDDELGKLYAMLRLRLNPATSMAMIRELQVFGKQRPIKSTHHHSPQHQKLGAQLMARAEQLALDAGFKQISVISGVGVRGYYRSLGYDLVETYMVKQLSKTNV